MKDTLAEGYPLPLSFWVYPLVFKRATLFVLILLLLVASNNISRKTVRNGLPQIMTLAEIKAQRAAKANGTVTTNNAVIVDTKEMLKPFIGFKTFPKGGLKIAFHTFGVETQYEALALIKGNGDAIQLYNYDKVETKLTNKIVGEAEIIELAQLEKLATIEYDNSRKYASFSINLLDVENDF